MLYMRILQFKNPVCRMHWNAWFEDKTCLLSELFVLVHMFIPLPLWWDHPSSFWLLVYILPGGPGYGLHFADSQSTEPTEIEGQEVYFEFNMGPANAQIPISVFLEGWTAMAAILLENISPLVKKLWMIFVKREKIWLHGMIDGITAGTLLMPWSNCHCFCSPSFDVQISLRNK